MPDDLNDTFQNVSPLKPYTQEEVNAPKKKDPDELKVYTKQLGLAQKLAKAVVDYISNEEYDLGPEIEQLKEIHKHLEDEQSELNDRIRQLL